MNGPRYSAESESQAQAQLISGSTAQEQLTEAQGKVEAAQRHADHLNATLSAAWNEFQLLPERVERLHGTLETIEYERGSTDETLLETEFKRLYRLAIEHPESIISPDSVPRVVDWVVTAQWRLQILKEIEGKTNAAIEALRERNRELAKELGQPPHKLLK
jgi:hypothetical protein